MGQTVFWLKIGPITTFLDMDRGDRFPPMPPIRRYGSQGRPGPNFGILGWGGGGPMYAIVYPAHLLSKTKCFGTAGWNRFVGIASPLGDPSPAWDPPTMGPMPPMGPVRWLRCPAPPIGLGKL